MSFSLYVHLPFCLHKCPYCSFVSIVGAEEIMGQYAIAASYDLRHKRTGEFQGYPQTIYIGGGTPSIVPARAIKKIISDVLPGTFAEFTIEANPDSIDEQWLIEMLDCGVNRISIGIQSLHDSILQKLGRLHSSKQALLSVEKSRNAGFSNISVDLMFGVPGQTIEIWKNTLEQVLELQADHISAYSLGIEEDTVFYKLMRKKGLCLPEPEETADMYILMNEMFEADGLKRYEISNFARKGKECKHNQSYWNFRPYLGIGASAHSFNRKFRTWNESDPLKYIKCCLSGNDPTTGFEEIDDRKRILETLMLSLRTVEGIHIDRIKGLSVPAQTCLEEKIEMLINAGFILANRKGAYLLTDSGSVIADEILSELIIDIE